MKNQIETSEQQKDIAKFFARKLIDASRRIDPSFSKDKDPTDAFADALLHEYNGVEWKPSVAVKVSGAHVSDTGEDVAFFESYDSTPIFQKDFNVAAMIDVHIEVLELGERKYKLNINANILGYKVGGLTLSFDNGVLSSNNEYLSPSIDIWYSATISFNDGFHIEFDADVKPWLISKFHIGPLNLDF
ncbi:hypothetical protein JK621_06875 [Serratia plymuthica]|uniref:hypothetical protein n=1 Tax=Serratia plymuthica TaxID=82996 RepID=UPI000FBC72E6|nr:hypothetical protein [Serratia plymuthica]QUY49880.1 hypothetical protein JK621_06875 [Serratia plymuthica]